VAQSYIEPRRISEAVPQLQQPCIPMCEADPEENRAVGVVRELPDQPFPLLARVCDQSVVVQQRAKVVQRTGANSAYLRRARLRACDDLPQQFFRRAPLAGTRQLLRVLDQPGELLGFGLSHRGAATVADPILSRRERE